MINKLNYSEKIKQTILVVDDELINREILGSILKETYNVIYAGNGKEALSIIQANSSILSAILLDLLMPVMDGFEVLDILKADAKYKRIPVIVLTSEKQAEVESLKKGAADFITKPYDMPDVIIARIKRIIELSEDRLIIQAAERDYLTGLYSKTFFYEYVHLMNRYLPDRAMDAVVVNIDRFHLLNEIYGRSFGNQVLVSLAELISDFAQKNEGIASRTDADTFYIYLNHQKEYSRFELLLNEGLKKLSESVKVRVGVYSVPAGETDVEKNFDRAKLACNTLRGKYFRTVAFYDAELQHNTFFSERLIHDIHDGLSRKQFQVFFQPKYDISGDVPVLTNAEALIRWEHPDFGMVAPFTFVTLFEDNGLISLLDHYVWNEAAAKIRYWREKFGVTITVSVNVSRIDIYDADIIGKFENLIKKNDLSPSDLHLEITESAYSDNADQLVSVINEFRARGFKIEMDDFGAGYSSLNLLTTLPIDVLKLDMKFIQHMHENEKNCHMVKMILEMAKFLRLPVVAEGAETEEQYRLLKDMGCNYIQGYYFSKPVPSEEFEKLIERDAIRK